MYAERTGQWFQVKHAAVLSGVAVPPPPPPPSGRPRVAGAYRQSCASYLARVSICLAERALASRPQIRRIAGQ